MKNNSVLFKSYGALPIDKSEVLRYAGCKTPQNEILRLLNECIEEWKDKESNKICFTKLSVNIQGDVCDFGFFTVCSSGLAKHLLGCQEVLIFAATIGIELDRIITKQSVLSPSKAVLFQAIGAQQIEALCNTFCQDIAQQNQWICTRRFSPGYGDVSLEVQKEIFRVLDCEKRIGLTLNNSLLMLPTKSVTAFVGIQPMK